MLEDCWLDKRLGCVLGRLLLFYSFEGYLKWSIGFGFEKNTTVKILKNVKKSAFKCTLCGDREYTKNPLRMVCRVSKWILLNFDFLFQLPSGSTVDHRKSVKFPKFSRFPEESRDGEIQSDSEKCPHAETACSLWCLATFQILPSQKLV